MPAGSTRLYVALCWSAKLVNSTYLVLIQIWCLHRILITVAPVFSAGSMNSAFEGRRSESWRENGFGPQEGINFMWKKWFWPYKMVWVPTIGVFWAFPSNLILLIGFCDESLLLISTEHLKLSGSVENRELDDHYFYLLWKVQFLVRHLTK